MTSRLRNQRGQALAMTAFAMVALVGLTFLALNVAYLSHVATEVQAAADAAATAGAKALANGADVEAQADTVAITNKVVGQALVATDVTTTSGYYDIVNNTFSLTVPSGTYANAVRTTVTKNLTGSGLFGAQWVPYWSMTAPTAFTKTAYAVMPAPSAHCTPDEFTSDLPIGLGDCAVKDGQSFASVPDGDCHPLSSWTTKVGCDDNLPNTQKKLAWWAGYEDQYGCIDAREVEEHFTAATCKNGVTPARGYTSMSTTGKSTAKNFVKGSFADCVSSWITNNAYPTSKYYNIGMFDCTTLWNAEWCDQNCDKLGHCNYKTGVAYPALAGCAVVQVLGVDLNKDTLNLNVVSWTAVDKGTGEAETGGVKTRLVQPTPIS